MKKSGGLKKLKTLRNRWDTFAFTVFYHGNLWFFTILFSTRNVLYIGAGLSGKQSIGSDIDGLGENTAWLME